MKYRKHLSISAIKNKINGKVSPYGLIKKFGKSWIRKISYLNSSAIMGNCKVTMIDCSVSSDMLESIRSKKNYHFRLSANLSNPSTSEKNLLLILQISVPLSGNPFRSPGEKLFCNFIEIALRHGCSPVNLLHIFKTPFLKNTSGWLLLLATSNLNVI